MLCSMCVQVTPVQDGALDHTHACHCLHRPDVGLLLGTHMITEVCAVQGETSLDLQRTFSDPPSSPKLRQSTFGATLDFIEALCDASAGLTAFAPVCAAELFLSACPRCVSHSLLHCSLCAAPSLRSCQVNASCPQVWHLDAGGSEELSA